MIAEFSKNFEQIFTEWIMVIGYNPSYPEIKTPFYHSPPSNLELVSKVPKQSIEDSYFAIKSKKY